MIEQLIAGVVGGLCGVYVNSWLNNVVCAFCEANDVSFSSAPLQYIIAAITGAYLFIQWFC